MPAPLPAARGPFAAAAARHRPASRPDRGSLGQQRRDDHAAAGLVALAVSLDAGALLQPFVDDAAFLRAHRVHLDDAVVGERLLGCSVRPSLERLPASLPVTGCVDDHPFALADPAEGRLVAEQLQRVDRLTAFADQEPVVVLALDRQEDPLVVLLDQDLAVEVELVEDALDQLLGALGGSIGPVEALGHGQQAIRPPENAPGMHHLGWARWARSTPSQTRRAGSGRPPPPSTLLPARLPRVTRRCWSTSIPSATGPLHW